jgi:hypothetical protein
MKVFNFTKLFKSKKSEDDFSIKNYTHYISFWTAGLGYENRSQEVLKCNLNEVVELVREPANEIDSNAIHLKRKNGNSLGYVGKDLAEKIAPLLDQEAIKPLGQIISLKCDPNDKAYGVKVAVGITENLHLEFNSKNQRIDFAFDESEKGNLYLLVECDETTLVEIVDVLENKNVTIIRYGTSYIDCNDGNYYSWYLRLENNVDKENISKILRNHFNVLKEKYDKEIEMEYVNIQDEEIETLRETNKLLQEDLNKKTNQIVRLTNRTKERTQIINTIIDSFIPNIEFLRDSKDILENEIGDFSIPIKDLVEFKNNNNLKLTPIKGGTSNWYEKHFNTGDRDDGRLYIKRENNKTYVLISFKKTQKKDIEYLKKY